jgi:hypothetical protein
MFCCCDPALALEGQVALTPGRSAVLRRARSRAFLISEETMKRRLSRAKLKIKQAGIPFGGAGRTSVAGPLGRRPGGDLLDLQRALPGPHRPGSGGDPARTASSLC